MSYRYIGNKTRLVPKIIGKINEVLKGQGTVADLMCGTASVAAGLRMSGYKVIASDLMTYAYHHAVVRLQLSEAPAFAGLKASYYDVLRELQALPQERGYFWREYSPEGTPEVGCAPRAYFSAANAAKIDAINRRIRDWRLAGTLTDLEHSLLRHDLILAANKVANIAGTYGHFRSAWSNGSLGHLQLAPTEFSWVFPEGHVVMQGPAEQIADGISAELCYLDPPYMKRQYAANYHILETLARGDEPPAIGVSGLRPWRDQYSNFCSKVKIRDSFRQIIQKINCPLVMVSYSEDGLLTHDQIMELLSEFGDVSLDRIPFVRFRSNGSNLERNISEYLFCIRRPTAELQSAPTRTRGKRPAARASRALGAT